MPTSKNRRRIEIPVELYDRIEREARWLHMPITNLVGLLLEESVGKRFAPTGPSGGPGLPSDQVSGPALGVAGLTRAQEYAAVNARDEARLRGHSAETSDVDPLERDHSPAAIAEALAPVRHPDRGEGDGSCLS